MSVKAHEVICIKFYFCIQKYRDNNYENTEENAVDKDPHFYRKADFHLSDININTSKQLHNALPDSGTNVQNVLMKRFSDNATVVSFAQKVCTLNN